MKLYLWSAFGYETSKTPVIPTYGMLLDGTFLLTGGELYSPDIVDEEGDVIATVSGTLEIAGNTIQTVTTTAQGETRSTLTIGKTNNGTDDVTFTSTCQSPAGDAGTTAGMPGTYAYTIPTGELILELQVSKGVVLSQFYTRM